MRFLADVLLLLAVLYLPWWFVLLYSSLLFFMFERFYELFVAALLMDLLYGAPIERLGQVQFVLSLIAAALFLLFSFAKKRVRV